MGPLLLLLALHLGCGGAPPVVAEPGPGELRLQGAQIERVVVRGPGGELLLTRRLPAPVDELRLPGLPPGSLELEVQSAAGLERRQVELQAAGPFRLLVEAPAGQDRREVSDGEVLSIDLVEGGRLQVALLVELAQAATVRLRRGEELLLERADAYAGERLALMVDFEGGPQELELEVGGERRRLRLEPRWTSAAELAATLRIAEVRFPAEMSGQPDPGRAADRVSLPSPPWEALLRWTGLGFRPRDRELPWAWQGVVVENHGPRPINALLRAEVLDLQGGPAGAFDARLREGREAAVQALIRVPAGGQALATLPLYVDDAAVEAGRPYERRIRLLPLGSAEAAAEWRGPLVVQRGSALVSLGLVLSLLGAAGGALLASLRLGRWLDPRDTRGLVTIALFAALQFVVGSVAQLLSMGVGSLLGPFAPILTGLVDDALSTAILGCLLYLRPRPGSAALLVLVSALLRGMATGSLGLSELLFVCLRLLLLEGALWAGGISRGGAWREEALGAQWLRMGLSLGLASALGSALGLALHAVLYRLWFAGWYVAMIVTLPGFLYVLISARLAVGLAPALRRVES